MLVQFWVTELYPCVGKILSTTVNIFAYEFKVYSFLVCNKVYNYK